MLRMNTKIDRYVCLRLEENGQHRCPASKRRNLQFTSKFSVSFQSFTHMNSSLDVLGTHTHPSPLFGPLTYTPGLDLSAKWGCALFLPHVYAARFSAPM